MLHIVNKNVHVFGRGKVTLTRDVPRNAPLATHEAPLDPLAYRICAVTSSTATLDGIIFRQAGRMVAPLVSSRSDCCLYIWNSCARVQHCEVHSQAYGIVLQGGKQADWTGPDFYSGPLRRPRMETRPPVSAIVSCLVRAFGAAISLDLGALGAVTDNDVTSISSIAIVITDVAPRLVVDRNVIHGPAFLVTDDALQGVVGEDNEQLSDEVDEEGCHYYDYM